MRLAFMGTPDFAAAALAALLEAGHEIACVYTQPPRPAGRGHKARRSPVHELAAANGIEVRTPKSLKDEAAQAEFAALDLDAAVVAAYGLILPRAILDAPRHGCFNIHASLLPRWRGAAPIQHAILAGDAESGITIMQMDAGLDTGAMLLKRAVPITGRTTAGRLHDALAALGADLIRVALDMLATGALVPEAQDEAFATYAPKITTADGKLDWTQAAEALERRIRAMTPWPGAWFEHDGQRFKIGAAALAAGAGEPGTVLDDALTIACGSGALRPLEVQRPGKAMLPAAEFLRGAKLPEGTRL